MACQWNEHTKKLSQEELQEGQHPSHKPHYAFPMFCQLINSRAYKVWLHLGPLRHCHRTHGVYVKIPLKPTEFQNPATLTTQTHSASTQAYKVRHLLFTTTVCADTANDADTVSTQTL